MIHKNFRGVVVTALSLCVSGVLFHTEAKNTAPGTPTQNTTPTPMPRVAPNLRAQAATVQVPAELSPGIAALQSAKSTLENAGDKWGGHRLAAIRLINKALRACGQTQTPNSAATNSSKQDSPEAMQAGVTQLTNAKNVFEKSGNTWGGRRAKAIAFIDQALQELQAATNLERTQKRPKQPRPQAAPPVPATNP